MRAKLAILAACIFVMAGVAEAKTVRATEIGESLWSKLSTGALSEIVIEFRRGDELPVNLRVEGDLLETTHSATSYIGVKRNFWLKVQQNNVQFSFDGVNYSEITEALTGSVSAGTASDPNGGTANEINVVLKAFLK